MAGNAPIKSDDIWWWRRRSSVGGGFLPVRYVEKVMVGRSDGGVGEREREAIIAAGDGKNGVGGNGRRGKREFPAGL